MGNFCCYRVRNEENKHRSELKKLSKTNSLKKKKKALNDIIQISDNELFTSRSDSCVILNISKPEISVSVSLNKSYSNNIERLDSIKTSDFAKSSQFELILIKDAIKNLCVKKIISMMESESTILCENNFHPWAENPRTIGALATSYIGILAFEINENKETKSESKIVRNFYRDILESNCLINLVKFLTSNERDRMDSALVSLSFIVEINVEVQEVCLKLNTLNILINMMNHEQIDGVRITAAQTIHFLIARRNRCQNIFLNSKGTYYLLELFKINEDEVIYEVILSIEDIILDESDTVILERAEKFINYGLREILIKLEENNPNLAPYIKSETKNLLNMLDCCQA